jgi:hypothetical protein
MGQRGRGGPLPRRPSLPLAVQFHVTFLASDGSDDSESFRYFFNFASPTQSSSHPCLHEVAGISVLTRLAVKGSVRAHPFMLLLTGIKLRCIRQSQQLACQSNGSGELMDGPISISRPPSSLSQQQSSTARVGLFVSALISK